MEKEKKLVQRDYFNMLEKLAEENNRLDLVQFCQDRKAQLDKKANSSKSKSITNQAENEKIKKLIIQELVNLGRAVTVTELMKEGETLKDYSTQKLTYLLTKMYTEDLTVTNIKAKGKSLFAVAE